VYRQTDSSTMQTNTAKPPGVPCGSTRTLEANELGEGRVEFDGDQAELVSLANQLVCNRPVNARV